MFANDRSAKNAVRLAELNADAGNNDKAISYFTEAYNRDTNSVVRSDVLIRVAMMELGQGEKTGGQGPCGACVAAEQKTLRR